jgi:hypothetical protein
MQWLQRRRMILVNVLPPRRVELVRESFLSILFLFFVDMLVSL